MARIRDEYTSRTAGLAYSLGRAPVVLHVKARLLWGIADPEDSLFPNWLGALTGEIRRSAEGLAALLPAPQRDALTEGLSDAVDAGWRVLEETWLGPQHRGLAEARDGPSDPINVFSGSPFECPEWHDMQSAIRSFSGALPDPLPEIAALGANMGAIEEVYLSRGASGGSLLPHIDPSPSSKIQALVAGLSSRHPAFEGLSVDLSLDRYNAEACAPTCSFRSWALETVNALQGQLLARFATEGVPTDDPAPSSELWVGAMEASEIAESRFGVSVSLSQISKLTGGVSPPFRSRPAISPRTGLPVHNRRDVELGSFLVYVLQRKAEQGQAAHEQFGEDEPDNALRAEIEQRKAQASEKKRRERPV